MQRITKFFLIVLSLALPFISLHEASARVFVGGGVVVGAPYYYYPPYYGYYPPNYAYPPAYPYGAPPPGYDAPPPAYSSPMPPPSAQDRYYTESNGEYCREYHHSAMIDGQRQQVVGHACRQPDGSWRMMD